MSTFDVRVHNVLINKLSKGRSYTVRWVVAGESFRDTFATRGLADSFRSKLVIAQRKGVAFDEACGLPEPMARALKTRSWYKHAVDYVDVKWPRASAKHRKGIAETLATVTPALLSTDRGVPSDKMLRKALYGWSFNKGRRDAGEVPAELAATVRWLESNTVDLSALADAALVRKVLDTLALLMKDGKAAAPATIARKRAVFSGALKYAVELRLLETHPLSLVSWVAPKHNDEIDRKAVVNPKQARDLLAAVSARVPELEAFFGCMYYSALRPEEVLNLRDDEYERPTKKGGWGVLHLTGSTVDHTPAGGAFAVAMGAKVGLVETRSRLDLPPADQDRLDALLAEAWQHAGGYRIEQWSGVSAEKYLVDLAYLEGRYVLDAPMGDLAAEPEKFDAERFLAAEQHRVAIGRTPIQTGAVHEASGRMIALTFIAGSDDTPSQAWQNLTLVHPEHRGHRLGLIVKLENLRYIRQLRPELTGIDTINAAENERMLAINVAMGFRPADSWIEWQLSL